MTTLKQADRTGRARRALFSLGMALTLATAAATGAGAQVGQPPGSSPKVITPRTITEAGGEFQLDETTTLMVVYPYAERFEATARLRCTGTRGNVRLASFILNGGRRATDVTENGRPLRFTHVGDFLTVTLPSPMGVNQVRNFELRYTGKAHSVSSTWIRDYKINEYGVSLRVKPLTGNLTAVAKLTLLGLGPQTPPKPQPTRWPGVRPVKHWIPPLLQQAKTQPPKLGLVLNNNYAIDKVNLSGGEAPYNHANGVVAIDLGSTLQKGQTVPVDVYYTGKIRNSDRNRIWDNFDNDVRPSNPYGAE